MVVAERLRLDGQLQEGRRLVGQAEVAKLQDLPLMGAGRLDGQTQVVVRRPTLTVLEQEVALPHPLDRCMVVLQLNPALRG